MSVLFKKYQEGGDTTGLGRKFTPEEQAQKRAKAGLGNAQVLSGDMSIENDYLKESYKILSGAFKAKYPDIDYGQVKGAIDEINPNFRPEWKARSDQFANRMNEQYGDSHLTSGEVTQAFKDKGFDPQKYIDSSRSVLGRATSQGLEVPYQGNKEDTISNWGWRSLAVPIHSTPASEDRYFGAFD